MLAVLGLALAAVPSAAPSPSRAVATPVADGAMVLDGALDEPAWRQAPVLQLVQQDPRPGAPTPYATEVRVLVDRTHLYVAVTCVDPAPDRLTVHTLERDSKQRHDDHVTLVLDTFGTHRLGYVFQVNAGGARTDGLISPASRDPSYDWDGIWDAAVQRTATGWTAEIAIDSRSLQFRPGIDHWGFNLQRYVAREQLSLAWAGISLDADIFDVARLGRLDGVGAMEHGRGLEVSPYALVSHDNVGNRSALETGGDVRYQLTPSLAATATINPDFAEAEADTERINLTRFALFFPEKRRFFSEGSNLFAFGAGLTDNDTFMPFYSRRIGLVEGQTVRVDGGLKLLGSAGPWSIGALGVQTGPSSVGGPARLFAGRLAYDVNEHLRLGTLLTLGNPDGHTPNRFTGMDAVWHTARFRGDKNLTLAGWAARSRDPLPGRHDGWGFYAQYPNDLWDGYVSVNRFGDALDPALGFLPRPGTRQYDVYVDYRPRPDTNWLRWARQFFYQFEVQQIDDLAGRTQTRQIFTAPLNVDAESGEHYEVDWIAEYEALTAPFEIAQGVRLPPGQYRFDRYRVETQSSDTRRWRIGNVLEVGDFYSGRLTQLRPFVDWTALGGKLRLELENETDFGYLREGNFVRRLYLLTASYAFGPDLIISSLAQYDSGVGHTGVNLRLRWTLAPGRDFFVVFDHGVEASLTDPNARALPISNTVIAKLRWDFYR